MLCHVMANCGLAFQDKIYGFSCHFVLFVLVPKTEGTAFGMTLDVDILAFGCPIIVVGFRPKLLIQNSNQVGVEGITILISSVLRCFDHFSVLNRTEQTVSTRFDVFARFESLLDM